MFEHKEKSTGTTFLYFIMFFVPIVNLWWLWKVAKIVAQHESMATDTSPRRMKYSENE